MFGMLSALWRYRGFVINSIRNEFITGFARSANSFTEGTGTCRPGHAGRRREKSTLTPFLDPIFRVRG